jgi:hypothetical protein
LGLSVARLRQTLVDQYLYIDPAILLPADASVIIRNRVRNSIPEWSDQPPQRDVVVLGEVADHFGRPSLTQALIHASRPATTIGNDGFHGESVQEEEGRRGSAPGWRRHLSPLRNRGQTNGVRKSPHIGLLDAVCLRWF